MVRFVKRPRRQTKQREFLIISGRVWLVVKDFSKTSKRLFNLNRFFPTHKLSSPQVHENYRKNARFTS
jgi:hypothetical protein